MKEFILLNALQPDVYSVYTNLQKRLKGSLYTPSYNNQPDIIIIADADQTFECTIKITNEDVRVASNMPKEFYTEVLYSEILSKFIDVDVYLCSEEIKKVLLGNEDRTFKAMSLVYKNGQYYLQTSQDLESRIIEFKILIDFIDNAFVLKVVFDHDYAQPIVADIEGYVKEIEKYINTTK